MRFSVVYAAPSALRQLSGLRNWSCHISDTPSVVTPVSVSSVVTSWSSPLSNEGSVFSGRSPRPPRCAVTSNFASRARSSSVFAASRSSFSTCCSRSGRSLIKPSTPMRICVRIFSGSFVVQATTLKPLACSSFTGTAPPSTVASTGDSTGAHCAMLFRMRSRFFHQLQIRIRRYTLCLHRHHRHACAKKYTAQKSLRHKAQASYTRVSVSVRRGRNLTRKPRLIHSTRLKTTKARTLSRKSTGSSLATTLPESAAAAPQTCTRSGGKAR